MLNRTSSLISSSSPTHHLLFKDWIKTEMGLFYVAEKGNRRQVQWWNDILRDFKFSFQVFQFFYSFQVKSYIQWHGYSNIKQIKDSPNLARAPLLNPYGSHKVQEKCLGPAGMPILIVKHLCQIYQGCFYSFYIKFPLFARKLTACEGWRL